MTETPSQLANRLEWANYARNAYFASVVPGMEVTVARNVVLVTNHEVPTVDGNHAAMLRAAPDEADALIDRIVRHYREIGITPYVVLSPGCAPADLPLRLQDKGFKVYGKPETWLDITHLPRAEKLPMPGYLEIHKITSGEMADFCRVIIEAFEMPAEMLPMMLRGFTPINDLEGIDNYLALVNGKPTGCASLYHYLGYTALGSGAVLPGARFMGVGAGLVGYLYREWQKSGSHTLLAQTSLGKLEQILILGGGKKLFTRQYYALEDE